MRDLRRLESSHRASRCDMCGQAQFQVVSRRDRLDQELTTVICCHCGLVSHERIPSDQELAEYYALRYRKEYNGQYTPSPHRLLREWHRSRAVYERLSRFVPRGARVLDVGAGMGCLVKQFESHGHSAEGIEPGPGFCWFACQRLHAHLHQQSLADLRPPGNFDLVLLLHVLEHLRSPAWALRQLRQIVAPRGQLYLEVPNLAAPHSAPNRLFHYAHIYNFTPLTLQLIAQRCGWRVARALHGKGDKNLRVLLTAGTETRLPDYTGSYEASLEATQRASTLRYWLRPRYLAGRVVSLIELLSVRVLARRRAQRLLRYCEEVAARASRGEPPAARAAA